MAKYYIKEVGIKFPHTQQEVTANTVEGLLLIDKDTFRIVRADNTADVLIYGSTRNLTVIKL